MDKTTRSHQPRIFSATNWGYTILPLLGLALPQSGAAAEDEFSFDGTATHAPQLDLTDILPGMIQHFGSTQYQLGRHDLKVAGDGSTYTVAPAQAEPVEDASAQGVPEPQADDLAG